MTTLTPILFVSIIIVFVGGFCTASNIDEERKVYIVYMGSPPRTQDYSPSTHLDMLNEAVDSRFVEKSLIRSYKRSFNGFAASLTDQEMQKIKARDEVLLVIPSRTYQLQTTASWDFMGFHQNATRNPRLESDIIVGVIDSGIWPESDSFNDRGFGPIPKKWKGECQGGTNFTCNKKLIGARNYVIGESSVRDVEGHGTHTASTAAGSMVGNASFYGLAKGTARGGVPSARIAAYRVCGEHGCDDHAILAAFDDAIADGVDIISLSVGSIRVLPIQEDIIAIGSFNAVKRGVLTVHAAGNVGATGSVSSTAPWLFTVGASSMARKFISKVSLGNGNNVSGNAINVFRNRNATEYPLVDAMDASLLSCPSEMARQCSDGCLDKQKVKGKIVLCATSDSSTALANAKIAGGVGVIGLDEPGSVAFVTPGPYVPLDMEIFQHVGEYIKSTKTPKASFLKAEVAQDETAPVVASFSSRGPNGNYPDILKPDIAAPGVGILAAYPPTMSPSGDSDLDHHRSVNYNILSGTSMACPHVTAAAAYVKSLHPNWSPSAIKSALMTTAGKMDSSQVGNRDAEFAYGAGHLNPTKAANPGLVYEASLDNYDYIRVICGLNASIAVTTLFGAHVSCNRVAHLEARDLNYPTLSAKVPYGSPFKLVFPRTVTNVGNQNSTYQAKISGTSNLNVTVEPDTLSFKAIRERKAFNVTVAGVLQQDIIQVASASLQWSDGIHAVTSPIVVYTDFVL